MGDSTCIVSDGRALYIRESPQRVDHIRVCKRIVPFSASWAQRESSADRSVQIAPPAPSGMQAQNGCIVDVIPEITTFGQPKFAPNQTHTGERVTLKGSPGNRPQAYDECLGTRRDHSEVIVKFQCGSTDRKEGSFDPRTTELEHLNPAE